MFADTKDAYRTFSSWLRTFCSLDSSRLSENGARCDGMINVTHSRSLAIRYTHTHTHARWYDRTCLRADRHNCRHCLFVNENYAHNEHIRCTTTAQGGDLTSLSNDCGWRTQRWRWAIWKSRFTFKHGRRWHLQLKKSVSLRNGQASARNHGVELVGGPQRDYRNDTTLMMM